MKINFNDYDKCFDKFLDKSVNELMPYLQPMLKQVEIRKEKNRGTKKYNVNNDYKETNINRLEAQCTMKMSELYNTNIEEYLVIIYEIANKYSSEMVKIMLENIKQICDQTGNIVNARGNKFSYSFILDSLEKMDISFDEDGNPIKPTLVANPQLIEQVINTKPTEEELKREQEIYARKKEEYYAKKYTRKLH